MFDWLWNYWWFWTFGWWIIMILVLPFCFLLPRFSDWLWKNHPNFRLWIGRNLDI